MSGGRSSRVVVTGAAGFIGAALVRRLADESFDVHAMVHPRTDRRRLQGLSGAVRLHLVDLADPVATSAAFEAVGRASVIHTAAGAHSPAVDGSSTQWRDTVTATEVLLAALGPIGADRFVHLGSSFEYAPSDHPLTESSPCRPETRRGRAKLASSEAVLRWSSEEGVPATILRVFRAYGPGEQEDRLIRRLLDAARSGSPIATPASPTRRDYVHVDDVVGACLLAIGHPAQGPSVFNIGTGREHTVDEVVGIVEEVTGASITRASEPRPLTALDRGHSVADVTRARAELGWRPTLSLHEGIALMQRNSPVG